MYKQTVFTFLALIGITINAQTINLRGNVSNQNDEPVSGAIVELVGQALADTTNSNGEYSITKNLVSVLPSLKPETDRISLNRGILEFRLSKSSPVEVKIFDVKGNLLTKESVQRASEGIYQINLSEKNFASNLLIIQAKSGTNFETFRYLPLYNNKYLLNSPNGILTQQSSNLSKIAAGFDSLRVTAEGYNQKTIEVSSYDTIVDITLDTTGEEVCEGCGKSDYLTSGKKSIDVDGLTREYILKVPDNYDPNQQYKLIFCIHPWGGDMDQVANGGYYGLERLANGSAIFVSPNGTEENGQARGWFNTGGRDIKFMKALIEHFNANLCIDQKRIFSTGFSFGGMMSFAIGCAMADVFRAIAPMSGAFYSGCDDTNEDPIAVWMAHGTSDGVVPLNDGKTALQHFIGKNGCSNETVPVNPSPCVAYQGCKDGFPVIYCEFNGGHAPQSFAQEATWEFFSQF